jgi:hypothetical protein
MTVAPEMAAEMLTTSPGNRKIRAWYVKQLAAAMTRGEWRVTSQGVGFDIHGRLRDAHHRMHACVASGVPFETVVVMGISEDAYGAIDTGMKRNHGDLLSVDKRVAEVVALGSAIALNTNRPTSAQMMPIVNGSLGQSADALIRFCPSTSRFFSCTSMRLAACISIMDGGDADWIMAQYHALVHHEPTVMTDAAHALVRNVHQGTADAIRKMDALARGLKIFDPSKQHMTRIAVSEDDISAAYARVRSVILESMRVDEEDGEKRSA